MPKYSLLDLLAIDKLGHFTFYGSAAWCFMKYYKLNNQFHNLWFIGILLMLLGVSLECFQYLMKQGRSFDLFDILANGVGIFCGLKYFDFVIGNLFQRLSRDE